MARRTETHTRYHKPYRRLPVSAYNTAMKWRDWTQDFYPEKLISSAKKTAGETEFGPAPLREPLEHLCQSIREEAHLNPLGAFMQATRIKKILVSRLRLDALIRQNPHWQDAPDPDIIVIAGLARTGTTLLHRILCEDPEVRTLYTWEAMSPAPLPDEVAGQPVKRVAEAAQAASFMRYIAPDFSAIHALVVDAPEEDLLLLDLTFMTQSWEAVMYLPTWSRWLETADHRPAYAYLKSALKALIGLTGGNRLVLKTPHHSEHLGALMDVFDQALIVRTHRDPIKTVPSLCSMVAHMFGAGSDQVDPHVVGQHWLRKCQLMSENARTALVERPDRTCIDVLYSDLTADPLAAAREIYQGWGKPLPVEVKTAASASTERKSTLAGMRHVYRATDFGFSNDQLREIFAQDIADYAIPPEESSA